MKVVWIVVGGILMGAIVGGAFFLMQQKPVETPVETTPVENEIPTPTSVPEMVKHQNDAGFSFEYPSDVTITENELDAASYADLELTSPEHPGTITIKIVDTKLKDLVAWKKQNSAAADSMKSEEATLGDLDAVESTLNSGTTTLVAIGQGVIYTITVTPEDNFEYWQEVYEGIVSSWTFELPETPTSAPAKSSGGGAPASGGDIYEEETIE